MKINKFGILMIREKEKQILLQILKTKPFPTNQSDRYLENFTYSYKKRKLKISGKLMHFVSIFPYSSHSNSIKYDEKVAEEYENPEFIIDEKVSSQKYWKDNNYFLKHRNLLKETVYIPDDFILRIIE